MVQVGPARGRRQELHRRNWGERHAEGEDRVCVVERRLAEVSGRFRAEVLKGLEGGEAHFAGLRRRATGASAHTLTRALRALEAAGLVVRRRDARWGPCAHTLTGEGRRTVAALDNLADP